MRPAKYKKKTDFDTLHHLFRRLVWRQEDILKKIVVAEKEQKIDPVELFQSGKKSLVDIFMQLVDAAGELEKLKKPEESQEPTEMVISDEDAVLVRGYLSRFSGDKE